MYTYTKQCPRCQFGTSVIYSRLNELNGAVLRVRSCERCGHKFRSVEIAEENFNQLIASRKKYIQAMSKSNK